MLQKTNMKQLKKNKKFKNIFFLGAHDNFNELIKINNNLGLKTFIISSTSQVREKKLDKSKIKILDKLDDKFFLFVKKNVNVEETIFVSLGGRWIYNKKIINFCKNGIFNFHRSRLPFDAGGGGFSWRIMNNDRIDNQLVHKITEIIDVGPILMSDAEVIPAQCILPDQIEKFSLNRFYLFYKNFMKKMINDENLNVKHPPESIGSYYPRLSTNQNGWIDWSYDVYDLVNFINAFEDPYIGASTFYKSKRVFIKKVQVHGGEISTHPYLSGLITRVDKNWLIVSTNSGRSIIIEKVMINNDINIIKEIKVGERFFTPIEKLENSKSFRAKYTPKKNSN